MSVNRDVYKCGSVQCMHT